MLDVANIESFRRRYEDSERYWVEHIRAGFDRWLRSGRTPCRAEFGPDFQDDWRHVSESGFYGARRKIIQQFGFALPCREAINALKTLSPIVEVGAGLGAWAHILAGNGVDIVATDLCFKTGYGFYAGRFHPVSRMSALNAVRRYADHNVLMIWPCYSAEWPTRAAREIRPGRHLALISEGEGGCVAADSLFQLLDKRFRFIKSIRIPCWSGMHDRLEIFQRVICSSESN